MKRKKDLIFTIFFIVVSIFIGYMQFSIDFPSNDGYLTTEMSLIALKKVYPYLIGFIILLVMYFVLGIKGYNKIIFPITVICTTLIMINLGLALMGGVFTFLYMFIIPISIVLTFLSIIGGALLDIEQSKK